MRVRINHDTHSFHTFPFQSSVLPFVSSIGTIAQILQNSASHMMNYTSAHLQMQGNLYILLTILRTIFVCFDQCKRWHSLICASIRGVQPHRRRGPPPPKKGRFRRQGGRPPGAPDRSLLPHPYIKTFPSGCPSSTGRCISRSRRCWMSTRPSGISGGALPPARSTAAPSVHACLVRTLVSEESIW